MNNVIQDDKVSDTKDVHYKEGHRMGVQSSYLWLGFNLHSLGECTLVHILAMPTVPVKEL